MSSPKTLTALPSEPAPLKAQVKPPRKRRWRLVLKLLVVAAVLSAGAYYFFMGSAEIADTGPTYTVHAGPMKIMIVEGGNVAALESQEIKSEVNGSTKILSIVEEGSTVTQQDVDSGKILVELDSTDLREKQTAQELEYQNSRAGFTQAKEDFEIQQNQNQSDMLAAELAVKFGKMDFERYLGTKAGLEILKGVTIDASPVDTDLPDMADLEKAINKKDDERTADNKAEQEHFTRTLVDFSKYVDVAVLGDGEAGQKLRTLEDLSVQAKKDLGLARTRFEGSQRLAAKEFVTKNDLENERFSVEQKEIALRSAETNKQLFITYDFPKLAEKYLSDYIEACRKLQRAQKLALSKLAQAEARLKAEEARFMLQSQKRKSIQEQIDKCRIKALRTGLVVYAGGEDWRGDDRIEEGATVRERQKIITIPDMNQMAVKIKVHETSIKKVEKGQKATVRVEAFPDLELKGEVVKVGVLPDSQNRWMNPDVKVYEVNIGIEGIYPWLKPELTAQVEILVRQLDNVLYVPVQAVSASNGEKVCFVVNGAEPERRVVEIGESNDAYIEIKSGLNDGETVLLHAPTSPEENSKSENGNGTKSDGAKSEGAKSDDANATKEKGKDAGKSPEPKKEPKPKEEKAPQSEATPEAAKPKQDS